MTESVYQAKNERARRYVNTCVMIFGSINRGKRSTANNESEVNALAGVKSPPSSVNIPKETTVTNTGILFSIKVFNCDCKGKKVSRS